MLSSYLNALIDEAVDVGVGSPIDAIDHTAQGDVVVYDKNNELTSCEMLVPVKFVTESTPESRDKAYGVVYSNDFIDVVRSYSNLYHFKREYPTSTYGSKVEYEAIYGPKKVGFWPALITTELSNQWSSTMIGTIGNSGILIAAGWADESGKRIYSQVSVVRSTTHVRIEYWRSDNAHATLHTVSTLTAIANSFYKVKVVKSNNVFNISVSTVHTSSDAAKTAEYIDVFSWTAPIDSKWLKLINASGYWLTYAPVTPLVVAVPYTVVIDITTNLAYKLDAVTGDWGSGIPVADLQRGVYYHDNESKDYYHLTFDGILEKIK